MSLKFPFVLTEIQFPSTDGILHGYVLSADDIGEHAPRVESEIVGQGFCPEVKIRSLALQVLRP